MLAHHSLFGSTCGTKDKRFHTTRFATTFAVGVLIFTAAPPAQAQLTTLYTLHDLGTLGGTTSSGRGVNDSGQIAGIAKVTGDGASHAFRSGSTGGTLTDLGTLGGTNSQATGINNRGEVAGYSDMPDGTTHAFRSSANGETVSLTDLGVGAPTVDGPQTNSQAFGINSSGMVVGFSNNPNFGESPRGFRSSPTRADGTVTLYEIGSFGPRLLSRGLGINDAGQVTGYTFNAENTLEVAFRTSAYDPNNPGSITLENLGSLGGYAFGIAINNSGQVAGESYNRGDTFQHAFRSSKNGDPISLLDLGTLGGNKSLVATGANGINSAGQVVGYSLLADNVTNHAFLYSDNLSGIGGTMYDLNNYLDSITGAGWTLQFAQSINDNGYISGTGTINGVQHGFLLTPGVAATAAPESSSLVLLVTALPVAGVVLARRRAR